MLSCAEHASPKENGFSLHCRPKAKIQGGGGAFQAPAALVLLLAPSVGVRLLIRDLLGQQQPKGGGGGGDGFLN